MRIIISLSIDPQVNKVLNKLSDKTNLGKSKIVENIIIDYLNKSENPLDCLSNYQNNFDNFIKKMEIITPN